MRIAVLEVVDPRYPGEALEVPDPVSDLLRAGVWSGCAQSADRNRYAVPRFSMLDVVVESLGLARRAVLFDVALQRRVFRHSPEEAVPAEIEAGAGDDRRVLLEL